MSKLSAFLKPSPAGKTKEVHLARFTDENGQIVPFVIKSITPEESERIARKCKDKKGNLDKAEYSNQLIVACMAEPDLRDSELCQFYGVMDPNMVPGRMFSIGEKNIISDAIMEINDLWMEQETLDEAKKLLREGDWETEAAFFAFVSFGIFPSDFESRTEREKLLMLAMMERAAKEMKRGQ